MSRAPLLAGLLGALSGVVLAVGVQEGWGLHAFWPGSSRWLFAVLLSGAGGGLFAALWARVTRTAGSLSAVRRGLIGAGVAASSAGLLVHAPLPWASLSVFGAGPVGALTLVVLPLALAGAGCVAAAMDGPESR